MPGDTVIFHRLAARELSQAFRWYERRGTGLGRLLILEVERATELIAADPERWPTFQDTFRWIRLKRFPYVLYFSVFDSNQIEILAVAHGRRRPGYWIRRASHP